jgi:hypothetical protein
MKREKESEKERKLQQLRVNLHNITERQKQRLINTEVASQLDHKVVLQAIQMQEQAQ